ncbi:hypothetical protein SO802_030803 [Lithocarpus litseifolius]|uniref:Uncharacterized protein n=1 Tax=Lithocarpus litseifolius TaxID=425828 RepID=A0AAW2BKY4_9ROSI
MGLLCRRRNRTSLKLCRSFARIVTLLGSRSYGGLENWFIEATVMAKREAWPCVDCRCCVHHHCLHRDSSTSKTTALPPPLLPLLRSDHRLDHQKGITPIYNSVKNRLHRTCHAPPRAASVLHALPRASTRQNNSR